MAASAGRLVVWLGVNNDPLIKGFAGATRAQQSWAAETTRGAGISRRGMAGMLELSRAAEDATVSYGLNGLQGAIRGAGNNVVAFLTLVSPLAGVIGGVGLAITSLLIPALTGAKDETRDLGKELDELMQRLDDISEKKIESVDFYAGVRGANREDLDKTRAELQRQLRDSNIRLGTVRDEIGVQRAVKGAGGDNQSIIDGLEAKQNEELKKREQIQSRLQTVARQRNSLVQKEIDLQGRLAEAEQERFRHWKVDYARQQKEIKAAEAEKTKQEFRGRIGRMATELIEADSSPLQKRRREIQEQLETRRAEILGGRLSGALTPEQADYMEGVVNADAQKQVDAAHKESRQKFDSISAGITEDLDPYEARRRAALAEFRERRSTLIEGKRSGEFTGDVNAEIERAREAARQKILEANEEEKTGGQGGGGAASGSSFQMASDKQREFLALQAGGTNTPEERTARATQQIAAGQARQTQMLERQTRIERNNQTPKRGKF